MFYFIFTGLNKYCISKMCRCVICYINLGVHSCLWVFNLVWHWYWFFDTVNIYTYSRLNWTGFLYFIVVLTLNLLNFLNLNGIIHLPFFEIFVINHFMGIKMRIWKSRSANSYNIEGWERKRSKCFIIYIHLDLFLCHPSNYSLFRLHRFAGWPVF